MRLPSLHRIMRNTDALQTAAVIVLACIALVAVYQSPRNLRVDIGGRDSGLVRDFFDPEQSPSYTFRWTRNTSSVILPAAAGGRQRLTIGLAAPRPAGAPPATLSLTLDDRPLGQFPLTAAYQRLTFDLSLPSEGLGNHTLVFTTQTFAENSTRPRQLGVAVDDVTLSPRGAPVMPPLVPLGAFILSATLIRALLARRSRTLALIAALAFILFGAVYQAVLRLPFGPTALVFALVIAFLWLLVVIAEYIRRAALPRVWAIVVFTMLVTAVVSAGGYLLQLHRMTAYDFVLFYHAAAVVTQHHPQELYDLSAGTDVNRIYRQPPIAASLMRPLAWLRYDNALIFWRVLLIACAIVAIVALVRALGLHHSGAPPGWPAIALAALTLVWLPMRETIALGQWDAPILLLLVLALVGLRRRIPALTGIALGLASAVKIYPVYLLVFLVMKREWRAVAWFIASGAALTMLGIVIAGWDTTRFFVRAVLPIGGAGTSDPENQSVMGFVIRLIGDRGASIFSALVFLVVTGLLIWRLRARTERGGVAYAGDYGLTICVMLLVIPVAWIHYETVLLLPITVIALLLARRPAIALPWLMVAVGSVALLTVGDRTSLLASLPYDTRDLGRAILLSTRLFAQGGLVAVLWRLTTDAQSATSLESPADAEIVPALNLTPGPSPSSGEG